MEMNLVERQTMSLRLRLCKDAEGFARKLTRMLGKRSAVDDLLDLR